MNLAINFGQSRGFEIKAGLDLIFLVQILSLVAMHKFWWQGPLSMSWNLQLLPLN